MFIRCLMSAVKLNWRHFVNVLMKYLKLENLLEPRESRMMPPPGLLIYLWSRVTLTIDLLL